MPSSARCSEDLLREQPWYGSQPFPWDPYITSGSCRKSFGPSAERFKACGLHDMKQKEGEMLKAFLARYNAATVRVMDPD